MNSVSIPSSQGRRLLSFANLEGDYFDTSISGDCLSAKSRVYLYLYAEALVELFDDIAANWKGWLGEKTWESLEGELKFTAISDKLGHVTLFVDLRNQNSEDTWKVHAPIFLDSGSLDVIAKNIRAFFAAPKIQAQQGAAANP